QFARHRHPGGAETRQAEAGRRAGAVPRPRIAAGGERSILQRRQLAAWRPQTSTLTFALRGATHSTRAVPRVGLVASASANRAGRVAGATETVVRLRNTETEFE